MYKLDLHSKKFIEKKIETFTEFLGQMKKWKSRNNCFNKTNVRTIHNSKFISYIQPGLNK